MRVTEESCSGGANTTKVELIMVGMDVDSDGAVTEDEFVSACFLHQELMNVLAPKAITKKQYDMEE